MRNLLAPAHLALTAIILIWDIVLAGRIAQNSQSSKVFQTLSGLAALLVLPSLMLTLATSTIITGRAVVTMDWIWPAVLVLFALQATYALFRRMVNPFWGVPIFVYDVTIAAVGVIRYLVAHGYSPPESIVTLIAAQSTAMVFTGGTSAVLTSPFYLNMPMVSPAFPALRNLTAAFRAFMSAYAVAWVIFIAAIGGPRAYDQISNYAKHRRDPLRERPDGDFAVGVKILPDISGPPSPAAIRSDSALADTLDTDALAVVVAPGATKQALDSLARVVDPSRRSAQTLILVLGYRGSSFPEIKKGALDEATRIATLRQAISKLHPDIVIPAEDPYGAGERALGVLGVERWKAYLTAAARAAKEIDPKISVGMAASVYTMNDSALYAWAASKESPIDIVGFSLFPSPYVGGGIQADTRTADRWMHATPPTKEQWVFATGGFPLVYGESSQFDAIWEVMAWATDHPSIKGLVVYEAGDYGQTRGLRAPNGRYRPATTAVIRAINQLRESAK